MHQHGARIYGMQQGDGLNGQRRRQRRTINTTMIFVEPPPFVKLQVETDMKGISYVRIVNSPSRNMAINTYFASTNNDQNNLSKL